MYGIISNISLFLNIETVPSWQLQGLQSVSNSQGIYNTHIFQLPTCMFGTGAQPPAPIPTIANSEHRKKMAAAKDIWSSDSETEDEKYWCQLQCMQQTMLVSFT